MRISFLIALIFIVYVKHCVAQNKFTDLSCHQLDSIFIKFGEELDADEYFDLAQTRLKSCQSGYNSPSDSNRLNHLSFAAYSAYLKGDYVLSIEQYKDFLENLNKVFGRENIYYAQDLSMLGTVYHSIGNFLKAENYLEESIIILKKLAKENFDENAEALWTALNNVGYLYMDMLFPAKAEAALRESLKIIEDSGLSDSDSYLTTLNNLAISIELQERYKEAEHYQSELLQKSKKLYGSDSPDYGIALNNAAIFFLNAGNIPKAEQLIREAIKIDINRKRIINLAQILEEKGDFENALKNYSRIADKIITNKGSHPEDIQILNLYAGCLLKDNQIEKAKSVINEALSLNRISTVEKIILWISPMEASTSFLHLAKAESNQKNPNYIRAYEYIVEGIGINESMWNDFLMETDILLHQKRSLELLGLGIEIAAVATEKFPNEKKWSDIIISLSDRKRAALLKKEKLSEQQFLSESDSDKTNLSKLKTLYSAETAKFINADNKEDKEKHTKELLSINNKIGALEKKLSEFEYSSNEELDTDKLKSIIPKDVQILEYSLSDSFLIISLVSTNNITHKRVKISRKKLEESVLSYLKELSDFEYIVTEKEKSFESFCNRSHELFKILLDPVYSQIQANEKLVIIPDGILCLIPFESLLISLPDKENNFSNLKYLITEHSISYHFSAALWLIDRLSERPLQKNLLAYSGHYSSKEKNAFRPLPAAEEEINFLSEQFKGIFFKEGDFEKHYRQNAGNSNIIHIAAHGIIDAEHPILNGILLSDKPSPESDNFLQAYEIRNIPLRAEMVVLSACKSGLAKIVSGEGPFSLARSFYRAGAASVLVSLWQVNDKISAELMKNYYLELKKGLPKSEALQKAKLKFMANNDNIKAHPAFWSSFVLIGNDGTVTLESRQNIAYLYFFIALIAFIFILLYFLKK